MYACVYPNFKILFSNYSHFKLSAFFQVICLYFDWIDTLTSRNLPDGVCTNNNGLAGDKTILYTGIDSLLQLLNLLLQAMAIQN